MATKKPVSTALVKWEEEMAKAAAKGAKAEKNVGSFKAIKTRGGILTVDDVAVKNNELRAIVLLGVHTNTFYTTDFDSDNPVPPDCYAFGDVELEDPESEMKPHEEAEDPQCESCAECPNNVMGSAAKGKGKACKNTRRLAIITEDALEDPASLLAAEVRTMNVPVMSVKGWAAYVKQIAEDMKRPPWGVVTKIKLVPDPKSQFKVTFAFEELVPFTGELYEAMQKKLNLVKPQMVAPFPKAEEKPVAPPRNGRGAAPAKKVAMKQAPRKAKY